MLLLNVPAWGQWTTTHFSEAKVAVGAVAYGSKVWFGGGSTGIGATNRVEIYDLATGNWSLEQFSIPRSYVAVGATGGKIFFAGGINFGVFEHYSRIDIFDTLTLTWAKAELSTPKFDVAAVSYGDQLFLAGGVNLATGINDSTVDIYHAATGQWTKAFLSQAGAVRATVSDSKVIFVGTFGASAMDIYDAATNTWTTENLPYSRLFPAVTALDNKLFIAGGVNFDNTLTDRVDIYDLNSREWSVAKLSMPRGFLNNATKACGKAFFAGGGSFDINTNVWWPIPSSNRVDIFNPETGGWTTDQINNAVVLSTVVSNGNYLLVAGGTDSTVAVTAVNIYNCDSTGVFVGTANASGNTSFFNNPAADFLYFRDKFPLGAPGSITLTSTAGQVVLFEKSLINPLNISNLRPGIYFLQVKINDRTLAGKLMKQ